MPRPQIPIAVLESIDHLCTEFEESWQSGESPSIEALMKTDRHVEYHNILLHELIALDVDYRRRRGLSPNLQDYVERFPKHAGTIEEIFDQGKESSTPFATPGIDQIENLFPSLDVLELLGAGGMGAVYKARQKGLDRTVALKILPDEFGSDSKLTLRFAREARTLAKLDHPNIVSVYEFGHIGETYYFLMEFVDGPTLRDVVHKGDLTPKQALAIIPHLCDALQYAHDTGVIHRDIKPENILLTRSGQVKIVDFGLSRILGGPSETTGLTGSQQVMGTPRYMAPEQFEGAHHVDHRADIYSLGVVFYELLTGELPMGRFAAPSKKVSIDVRLDEVVLRTLEKEPRQRYQAASDLKSDVQTIVASDHVALTETMVTGEAVADQPNRTHPLDAQEQQSAAQMLLTRRELMMGVRHSLRPLRRWQVVQLLIGILFVALGAYGWARNTSVPHRLLSGLIVHFYGVGLIAASILVMVRIKEVDVTQSLEAIRGRIENLRRAYSRFGPFIGLAWWWLWIPVGVSAGFDQIMHRNSLVPSLIVGIAGFAVSLWLIFRIQRPHRVDAERWKAKLAGASLRNASKQLDEIEQLGIW